eukprot:TRINITY_DN16684_c0_g1_i1.p1 TRINITY_DN16684_c0_g1~~TRINITY_DN16684_c0_g1_i1.p1  ORF type:complete len:266 (+),score=20.22 TRINITY_DN16684_c0_g1_i1:100-897(+)
MGRKEFADLVPSGRKPPAVPKTGGAGTSEVRSAADGPYHSSTRTVGRYKNVAACANMLGRLARLSSGAAHTVDWQLNLRGSDYHTEDSQWRRYFQRPAQSFDNIKERQADQSLKQKYESSPTTPRDPALDRHSGALPAACRRDTPGDFERYPGCEGAQVGQWSHLLTEKEVHRDVVRSQTTLRDHHRKKQGFLSLGDNRSDACWVEMMGKKKWFGGKSREPLAQPPPIGDPKLYHRSVLYVQGEPDCVSRKLRMTQHSRASSRAD